MDELDGVSDKAHNDEAHRDGLSNFYELYSKISGYSTSIPYTFFVRLSATVEEMDRVFVELARDVEDQLEGLRHDDLAPTGVSMLINYTRHVLWSMHCF
jgi:hypothetical protein